MQKITFSQKIMIVLYLILICNTNEDQTIKQAILTRELALLALRLRNFVQKKAFCISPEISLYLLRTFNFLRLIFSKIIFGRFPRASSSHSLGHFVPRPPEGPLSQLALIFANNVPLLALKNLGSLSYLTKIM